MTRNLFLDTPYGYWSAPTTPAVATRLCSLV